ncbi:hypothetical protein V8C86DRAFT_3023792, partial [Haematococcus lacustris]
MSTGDKDAKERVPLHLQKSIDAGLRGPRLSRRPHSAHPSTCSKIGTPASYAEARQAVHQWQRDAEQQWVDRQQHGYEGNKGVEGERVWQEQSRLVAACVGPGGLEPAAWGRLPRQLQLLAEHKVQRAMLLEKERLKAGQWQPDPRGRLAPALHPLQHTPASQPGVQQQQQQAVSNFTRPVPVTLLTRGAGSLHYHTTSEMEEQLALARSSLAHRVVARMQQLGVAGLDQEEPPPQGPNNCDDDGSSSSSGGGCPAAAGPPPPLKTSYAREFAAHLAADLRSSARGVRLQAPLVAQASRVSAQSTAAAQSMAASLASAARAAGGPGGEQQQGQQQGPGGRGPSPLVQAYLDASQAAAVYVSSEVAAALQLSQASRQLRVVAVTIPDAMGQAIASTLAACTHLTALHFSRTVLSPAVSSSLLPAAAALRLHRLELRGSDMGEDAWPHLQAALTRPTQALGGPPSEWWLSLRCLVLDGSPLGDRGFALLAACLPGLQALQELSLEQAGITDWAAPQVAELVRGCSRLTRLALPHNSLGPLTGQALAASALLHHGDGDQPPPLKAPPPKPPPSPAAVLPGQQAPWQLLDISHNAL